MSLIDQQVLTLAVETLILAPIKGLRDPELRRIILRLVILHHAGSVGRDTIQPAVLPVYVNLVERTVDQPIPIHRLGQEDRPDTVFILRQAQFGTLPIIKVAKEIDIIGLGQPLTEPPPLQVVVILPAEVVVAVGIIDNRARRGLDLRQPILIELVAIVQFTLHGLQPFILQNDRELFFHNPKRFDSFS